MSYGFDKSKMTDIDKMRVKILNYQLAFENYEDNTSIKLDKLTELCEITSILRNESLDEKEQIKLCKNILLGYEELYKSLPESDKSRFIFYEDEKIGYSWNKNTIKSKEK